MSAQPSPHLINDPKPQVWVDGLRNPVKPREWLLMIQGRDGHIPNAELKGDQGDDLLVGIFMTKHLHKKLTELLAAMDPGELP